DKMDEEIVQYMKKKYNMLIGERSAEVIKATIGTAYREKELRKVDVKGRDLISGIPQIVEISSEEVREAIAEPINIIINSIKDALENSPPELAGDIVDRGITLTGGGALLRNLDVLIREETRLPVTVADDPLSTVVRGAGIALDDIDILREIAIQT
ncbi:MAG: rod shape-determining protein, partial [Deltaproteobacteria bacterium]